jgi:hypothetical protein
MRQAYFCPNCRGTIVYPDRFCGSCGTALIWEIQPAGLESANMPDKSSDDAAAKLHDEISRLLAELFEKREKHAPVGGKS